MMSDKLPNPPHKAPSEALPSANPLVREVQRFARSYGFAWQGVQHLFRSQPNARIHLCAMLAVVVLGLLFQIDRWEWLILSLICALVLFAEGVNTALEAVVDLASPEFHPQAKIAKDVAAGAVLLCAFAAIVIGCLIFLPRIWALMFALNTIQSSIFTLCAFLS
jgi:diacylglycerol kinase (ATP)